MNKKGFGIKGLLASTQEENDCLDSPLQTEKKEIEKKKKLVRSSIVIEEDLHKKLRLLAVKRDMKLKDLLRDIITDYLSQQKE